MAGGQVNQIEAYPLQWPHGFKRTQYPQRSAFKAPSFGSARDKLLHELHLLRATNVILSTNIPLRKDGLPYSGLSPPKDRGVAVYFRMKAGMPRSLACDKWIRIEDNIHALYLTVNAMRSLDRWGASDMLERVFTGFMALPAPTDGSGSPWWEVLGLSRGASETEIDGKYKELAKKWHPDAGGSAAKMANLNRAVNEARSERC